MRVTRVCLCRFSWCAHVRASLVMFIPPQEEWEIPRKAKYKDSRTKSLRNILMYSFCCYVRMYIHSCRKIADRLVSYYEITPPSHCIILSSYHFVHHSPRKSSSTTLTPGERRNHPPRKCPLQAPVLAPLCSTLFINPHHENVRAHRPYCPLPVYDAPYY